MKCSKCGAENPDGRKVCTQCGDAEEPGRESRRLNDPDDFEKSLTTILSDQGSAEERIEILGKALQSGLPLDDEIKTHAFLGAELFTPGTTKRLSTITKKAWVSPSIALPCSEMKPW